MNCCSDLISFFGFFFFTDFVVDFPAGADSVEGVGAGVGLSTAPAIGGNAMVKAKAPPASNARTGQESRQESHDEIFVMNSLQAAVGVPAPRRFALNDDFR